MSNEELLIYWTLINRNGKSESVTYEFENAEEAIKYYEYTEARKAEYAARQKESLNDMLFPLTMVAAVLICVLGGLSLIQKVLRR